jgi:hypothetical protein
MSNMPLQVTFRPSAKTSASMLSLQARNKQLSSQIARLKDELEKRPVLATKAEFKREFQRFANGIRTNVFSIAGMLLQERFGKDFEATYWAGGIDVEPAKIMGGEWTFTGLGYGHFYAQSISYCNEKIVNEAGFFPLNHNVTKSELPPQMDEESQDVCMIKTPGRLYSCNGNFRGGLWECAYKALRPDGILISTRPIHEMSEDLEGPKLINWCQENFNQVKIEGLEDMEYPVLEVPWELDPRALPHIFYYPVVLYQKCTTLSPLPRVSS